MTISLPAFRTVVAAALIAVPAAALAQVQPPAGAAPAAAATPAPDICSTGLSAVVSRPTQTTSVCTVKANHVLLETGYQSQSVVTAGGSYTFFSFPNATIRVGTALKNVELQVLPPTALRANGQTVLSDVGAGLKWQIGSTPSFAYGTNVIVTAPTGTDPALTPTGLGSANGTTWIANANVQGTLGPVFGYGATLGVQRLAAAAPAPQAGVVRYTSIVPSVDLTAALPSNYGIALEAFRQSNGEGPATPAHTWFDVALNRTLGKAQIDVSYGVSNAIAPAPGAPTIRRRYVGFGLSYGF
ncbi:MAG: hypothetical protein NVS3B7_04290 [Candidatus Elarobacter sp.]